jgi:hypothetical protein
MMASDDKCDYPCDSSESDEEITELAEQLKRLKVKKGCLTNAMRVDFYKQLLKELPGELLKFEPSAFTSVVTHFIKNGEIDDLENLLNLLSKENALPIIQPRSFYQKYTNEQKENFIYYNTTVLRRLQHKGNIAKNFFQNSLNFPDIFEALINDDGAPVFELDLEIMKTLVDRYQNLLVVALKHYRPALLEREHFSVKLLPKVSPMRDDLSAAVHRYLF